MNERNTTYKRKSSSGGNVICSTCQRDDNGNPVAYYNVGTRDNPVMKCWRCMSSTEKLERDGSMKDPRRFKMQRTIKEDS